MLDFPQERIVADGDTLVWIGRCSCGTEGPASDRHAQGDIWTFQDGKAVRFFEMFDSLGFAGPRR